MHTRSKAKKELFPYTDDIERKFRKLRLNSEVIHLEEELADQEIPVNMAGNDQKSLREYAMPNVTDLQSSIKRPTINANSFEIKPGTIQMLQNTCQFGGNSIDDPNEHILSFLEVCDTFKFNNVSEDAIRLRMFPFTLKDKARSWLHSMPPDSITTWDDLAQNF